MKNNKSGLVLAEAMMAVALLAISVVVTGSIISSSVSTTFLSRNYLIAQNLATEGIEVVKTIRNTNWLLYPSDPSCWLILDPSGGCGHPMALSDESYVPVLVGGNWSLVGATPVNVGVLIGVETPHPAFERYIEFGDVTSEFAVFDVAVTWKEGQKDRRIDRTMTIYNYN